MLWLLLRREPSRHSLFLVSVQLPEFPTETAPLSPCRYEDMDVSELCTMDVCEVCTNVAQKTRPKRHPSTNRAKRRATKPSLRAVYGRTSLVRHDVAAIPRLTLRKPPLPLPHPPDMDRLFWQPARWSCSFFLGGGLLLRFSLLGEKVLLSRRAEGKPHDTAQTLDRISSAIAPQQRECTTVTIGLPLLPLYSSKLLCKACFFSSSPSASSAQCTATLFIPTPPPLSRNLDIRVLKHPTCVSHGFLFSFPRIARYQTHQRLRGLNTTCCILFFTLSEFPTLLQLLKS